MLFEKGFGIEWILGARVLGFWLQGPFFRKLLQI